MVLNSRETIRLIRNGEKGWRGCGGEGRGRLCSYLYAITTRLTPALRWQRFTTECAADFITISWHFFYIYVFFTPSLTLVSWAHYQAVRSFSALHSDVNKMFLKSRTEQFCVQITEEMHVEFNPIFISVERTFHDVLKNVSPRENVSLQSILTHND